MPRFRSRRVPVARVRAAARDGLPPEDTARLVGLELHRLLGPDRDAFDRAHAVGHAHGLHEAARALVEAALLGDPVAARFLLDRAPGHAASRFGTEQEQESYEDFRARIMALAAFASEQ